MKRSVPVRPAAPRPSRNVRAAQEAGGATAARLKNATQGGGTTRVNKAKVVNGDYMILPRDFVVRQMGHTCTMRLPDARALTGRRYVVEDAGGGAGSGTEITVAPIGGQLIGGNAAAEIATAYGRLQFRSDGLNWVLE